MTIPSWKFYFLLAICWLLPAIAVNATSAVPFTKYYADYLLHLKSACTTSYPGNDKCCLKSVQKIKKQQSVKAQDLESCQKIDQLKCANSYQWCKDQDSLKKFEEQYYRNLEREYEQIKKLEK